MVNSLLMVPLIVRPRRLSLSIGRCSAYERSNDAPGTRRARPYAVPSPSGISPINLLSITWPMLALPVSSSGAVATTVTSVEMVAGSSVKSTRRRSPTRTSTVSRTIVRNPGSSTMTR